MWTPPVEQSRQVQSSRVEASRAQFMGRLNTRRRQSLLVQSLLTRLLAHWLVKRRLRWMRPKQYVHGSKAKRQSWPHPAAHHAASTRMRSRESSMEERAMAALPVE